MLINPTAHTNDGFFELIFLKNLVGFGPINKLFAGCKSGGVQSYDNSVNVFRLSKLKLLNKSSAIDRQSKEKVTTAQNINIDGEDL